MKVDRVIVFACLVFLTLAPAAALNAQPQGETCAVCHAALGVEQLTKPVEVVQG